MKNSAHSSLKICFLPAAEHKASPAILSLSLLVISQTSVVSKIQSFSVEDAAAANPVSHTYPSPSNVWKFSLISDQDLHKQTSLISRKGISSKFVFVPAYTAEESCAELIPASQMREFAASGQTVTAASCVLLRKCNST